MPSAPQPLQVDERRLGSVPEQPSVYGGETEGEHPDPASIICANCGKPYG
jgi:hypothetical protein